jgi:hypothetical protein
VEFKEEIEDKFAKSDMNKNFTFPRPAEGCNTTIESNKMYTVATQKSEEGQKINDTKKQLKKQLNSINSKDEENNSPLLRIESS